MNKHKTLLAEALKSVREVFSDTSVATDQTLESLREIIAECQIRIASIEDCD